MTGFDSKRQAAKAKLTDEADTLTIVYQRGFADGKLSAQRKPLTNEQITKAFHEAMAKRPKDASNAETNRLFVRAVEAAHGIKEPKP